MKTIKRTIAKSAIHHLHRKKVPCNVKSIRNRMISDALLCKGYKKDIFGRELTRFEPNG